MLKPASCIYPATIALALVLAVTSCGGSQAETVATAPTVVREAATSSSLPQPTTALETDVDSVETDAECTYLGAGEYDDDMQIELAFTSDLEMFSDVKVRYEVLDGERTIVDSVFYLIKVEPGEEVRMKGHTLENAPADTSAISCSFLGLEALDAQPSRFVAAQGDACTAVGVDSGDIQVRLIVTNQSDESDKLTVNFAMRGPDGERLGDAIAFTDLLMPGEQGTFDRSGLIVLPDRLVIEDVTCELQGAA